MIFERVGAAVANECRSNEIAPRVCSSCSRRRCSNDSQRKRVTTDGVAPTSVMYAPITTSCIADTYVSVILECILSHTHTQRERERESEVRVRCAFVGNRCTPIAVQCAIHAALRNDWREHHTYWRNCDAVIEDTKISYTPGRAGAGGGAAHAGYGGIGRNTSLCCCCNIGLMAFMYPPIQAASAPNASRTFCRLVRFEYCHRCTTSLTPPNFHITSDSRDRQTDRQTNKQ
jgi:hypothetical protein